MPLTYKALSSVSMGWVIKINDLKLKLLSSLETPLRSPYIGLIVNMSTYRLKQPDSGLSLADLVGPWPIIGGIV